ncbi:MAG: FixH family protein [Planctomycetota bacterium]
MIRRTLLVPFALAAAACGGGADLLDDATLRAPSSEGTFEARLVPEPVDIPNNEPFAMRLALVGPDGEAFVDYDEVTLDARMPAHGHGMLRDVDLELEKDGTLRAEGLLFHMAGHWEIHVDVRRGPWIERAQASVQMQP